MSDFFYDVARKSTAARRGVGSRPPERRGIAARGTIVKLLVGQGHGYIRLADDRQIFFHRADVRDGSSFNDFTLGDVVSFDLLEDDVSGARAVGVHRSSRRA